MKSSIMLATTALALTACASAEQSSEAVTGVTGTVIHHEMVESAHVDSRNVDVWLPPDYDSSVISYPVLYMHDGQNLFDPEMSYIGVDWGLDEAMTALYKETGQAAIVVGIWNTPKRRAEYYPRGMAELWSEEIQEEMGDDLRLGDVESDGYLQFLVEELKPMIDAEYRTRPDREHTMVMGSSMGGLISLYAITEYPNVFGRAAAISTHWPVAGEAGLTYLETALPAPGKNRIYFDYGTETLDAGYEPWQDRVDSLMEARGWTDGWNTVKFTGHDHSERSWQKRVPSILGWMMGDWIAEGVDGSRILKDQAWLSDGAREGRGAGTPGAAAAQDYVREAFEAAGLEDVQLQPFTFGESGTGTNVLGLVQGTVAGAGALVITAHFDHLGTRDGAIYNGADDNASGTAALMELARQIAAQPLRRPVLFAAVDAEEKGLRGARALVQNPPIPLETVVLNINMDMISRSEKGEMYAVGTYHYPALAEMIEDLLEDLPVTVLLGHDRPGSEDWTTSSDHGPFHEAGIPFLYFGVEDHPGYHHPSDDFEDVTTTFYVEAVSAIYALIRSLDSQLDGRATRRP
ncbi:MAG: putative alpha/beta superfamily hydrolase [Rhodothermales bacterium]|jgi:predicted alpha/beta superfamily hydrolase